MTPSRPPVAASHDPGHDTSLAGHRIVRTLGVGDDARVLLAAPTTVPPPDSPSDPAPSRAAVALKVFDAAADDPRVRAEIAALDTVDDPHVVRLLDVSASEGHPVCVVLERLEGGSLAALLRVRRGLDLGEAVTILLGVGRGLEALHDAGWEHTRPTATRVLFDGTGRPVLVGLGEVRALLPDEAPSIDHERMARLCAQVLSSIRDDRRPGEAVVRAIERAAVEHPDELESALFDLAPPSPVLLPRAAGECGQAIAAEASPGSGLLEVLRRSPTATSVRSDRRNRRGDDTATTPLAPDSDGHRTTFSERMLTRIDDSPLAQVSEALGPWFRRRRRPMLVGAGGTAALLVLALVLLPTSGRSGGAESDAVTPRGTAEAPSATPMTSDADPSAGPVGGSGHGRSEARATDPPWTRAPAAKATGSDGVLQGDDPVAAAALLMTRRHGCLTARSDACLLSVDEPGSDLAVADLAAVRGSGATPLGTASPGDGADSESLALVDGIVTTAGATLVDRTGDAALVAITAPAAGSAARPPGSVLLLRGPEGWRLRDIYSR